MSLKTWWLAFVGALAVLVLIALSIARMYGPARPAPSEDAPVASAPSTPKETAHITATRARWRPVRLRSAPDLPVRTCARC